MFIMLRHNEIDRLCSCSKEIMVHMNEKVDFFLRKHNSLNK